jgi:hypothetical protein
MDEHGEPMMTPELRRALDELSARMTPEMWAATRRMMEGIQRGEPEFALRGRWVEALTPNAHTRQQEEPSHD